MVKWITTLWICILQYGCLTKSLAISDLSIHFKHSCNSWELTEFLLLKDLLTSLAAAACLCLSMHVILGLRARDPTVLASMSGRGSNVTLDTDMSVELSLVGYMETPCPDSTSSSKLWKKYHKFESTLTYKYIPSFQNLNVKVACWAKIMHS